MFHLAVMWVCCLGFMTGVMFQYELSSSLDFLFFHALMNCYVVTLAWLYLPAPGGGGTRLPDDGGGEGRCEGEGEGEGEGGGGSPLTEGAYHDREIELAEIEIVAEDGADRTMSDGGPSSGSDGDGDGERGTVTSMAVIRERRAAAQAAAARKRGEAAGEFDDEDDELGDVDLSAIVEL
jgi:hypothetical protein